MYFPQLDSIRGLSFLAIFLFHAIHISNDDFLLGGFIPYLHKNLPLGLEVFFILSAFLLTYLGLNEYKNRHNFSFKNYFTRRILRIWPLYFFILALAFLVFPQIARLFGMSLTLPNSLYYLFFIANFYTIDHVFFLRFLWTISVEEQFYLFWGLSLRFLHKKLKIVIVILFLFSVSSSVFAVITNSGSYYHTITYLFDFACGASAAILIFSGNRLINRVKNFSHTETYLFYSYLIFHFIIFYFLDSYTTGATNAFAALLNRYLFICYISFFLIEQMTNDVRTKMFAQSKFLIATGKLSYGLYCFHGITITFINLLLAHFKINVISWLLVIIYFVINYVIAAMSYRFLELPFLKLKNRWRRI